MAGEVMAESFPPELSGLLDSRDALSREDAWQRFVNRHSRLLLTTARETCADYDDGMERYAFLLDELKRDDCQRLRKYLADGRGKFTTWLVVVARRLCVDHHRKKYGRRRGKADVRADADWEMRSRLIRMVAEQVEVSDIPDGASLDPETQVRESERHRAMEHALASLDARDLLLIRLKFEDEVPVKKIVKVMGFSGEVSVYRRLKKVYQQLRGALEESGFHDPEA